MRVIDLPSVIPSPHRRHALAQARFAAALDAWAQERGSGIVGKEWEFHVAPPGENRRPLIPDIAYLSYRRVAPAAVIEVLSSDDRAPDVEEKVRVYLASGTSVVFLVDPEKQTVSIRDGSRPVTFDRDHDVCHPSLHGFTMPACQLFDAPRPLR
jgi:Uma2 family endonuclease